MPIADQHADDALRGALMAYDAYGISDRNTMAETVDNPMIPVTEEDRQYANNTRGMCPACRQGQLQFEPGLQVECWGACDRCRQEYRVTFGAGSYGNYEIVSAWARTMIEGHLPPVSQSLGDRQTQFYAQDTVSRGGAFMERMRAQVEQQLRVDPDESRRRLEREHRELTLRPGEIRMGCPFPSGNNGQHHICPHCREPQLAIAHRYRMQQGQAFRFDTVCRACQGTMEVHTQQGNVSLMTPMVWADRLPQNPARHSVTGTDATGVGVAVSPPRSRAATPTPSAPPAPPPIDDGPARMKRRIQRD
jgi:hypothetical protein